MRRVYLSFLGLGSKDPKTGKMRYRNTVYEFDGEPTIPTEFVQVAELDHFGAEAFDIVLIAATKKSKETHFENLCAQLEPIKVEPNSVDLEEDMSPEGQWRWFEALLDVIEPGDELTVDMTHGYRSVPIIFSAALAFLQRARNVKLQAVLYGAYDEEKKRTPIVDMKDFYVINEWADGVARLVEEADARKLADVAESAPGFQSGALGDPEMISAFNELTETIRNVDVNNVADKAREALALVKRHKAESGKTGQLLLDLVVDKFTSLAGDEPSSGKYDAAYFRVQLELAELLLEHRLFMQAYTVMREYVASLAMIPMERQGLKSRDRKRRRQRHAELFVRLVQFDEEKWKLSKNDKELLPRVEPFYRELDGLGLMTDLKTFVKELVKYRNGFDHAWICTTGAPDDIDKVGAQSLAALRRLTSAIEENGGLFEASKDK